MTSIFLPVSTGCGFLSRRYWLPSCGAAPFARPRRATATRAEYGQTRARRRIKCVQRVHVRILHGRLNAHWAAAAARFPRVPVGMPRGHLEFDHRDVEAALGELALHPVELVGVVVGAEADAKAHAPCPAGSPAESPPPSLRTRGAPSGSRRRPRSRTTPPAASSARPPSPPLSACARRARRLSRRPCRAPATVGASSGFGCTCGSSTPGRIL